MKHDILEAMPAPPQPVAYTAHWEEQHCETCGKTTMINLAPTVQVESAKQRYDKLKVEEPDPIERLKFFCSLAMSGDDWLDAEAFFDEIKAVQAEPNSNLHLSELMRGLELHPSLGSPHDLFLIGQAIAAQAKAVPASDDQFDRLNAEAQKAVALLADVIEQRDRLAARLAEIIPLFQESHLRKPKHEN